MMPRRMEPHWLGPTGIVTHGWARYGMAVVLPVIAGLLYSLLDPLLQPAMFLLLMPSVVVSAWFGGRGPAIVASLMSIGVADVLYYAPVGELSLIYVSDMVELVVFLGVALLVSSGMESLRSAWAVAESAHAEARAAVKGRDEVLAVVSHDLRNVVGAAQATVTVLLQGGLVKEPKGSEIATRTARILNEGEHLIRDLLDVGQAEAGRLALRERPADLGIIIREAVESLEHLARSRSVELACSVSESMPVVVDPERISRVCYNLIGNAIQHSPLGGLVRVGAVDGEEEIVVSVSDSGPGIRESDRALLFKPFWRGYESGGAGLGLAISKTLVEAHGGCIDVDSAPGVGSTFRFTVPKRAGKE